MMRSNIKFLYTTTHSPGRLAELVFKLGKIKLGMVRAVIIDEADQMLTEPYMDELTTVLEAIPMFRRGAGGVGGSSSSSQTTAIVRAAPTSVDDILDEEEDSDDTTENSTTSFTGHNSNPSTSPTSFSSDPLDITSNNTLETKRELTSYICLASATSTANEAVIKIANRYLRLNWQSIVMDSTLQLPPSITHGLISIPRIRALEMLRKFLNAQPSKCLLILYCILYIVYYYI